MYTAITNPAQVRGNRTPRLLESVGSSRQPTVALLESAGSSRKPVVALLESVVVVGGECGPARAKFVFSLCPSSVRACPSLAPRFSARFPTCKGAKSHVPQAERFF